MSKFSDDEWHENFRMSKSTFMYICREITPEIKKEDTKFRKAISVEKRVAITMWRLATGSDYQTIGHLFGVAKGTVCVIVCNVCEAIKLKLMPKHIKWSKYEHLKAIVADFTNNFGFPQCAGAIDGTEHIFRS